MRLRPTLTAAITATLMGTALALAAPAHATGVQYRVVPLVGPSGSLVTSVNQRDQAAGVIGTSDGGFHPAIWVNGTATDIGTSLGEAWGGASDINDRGYVVGSAEAKSGGAFIWHNGILTGLGTIPGTQGTTNAFAINDRNQVVGDEALVGGTTHAFVWQNGHVTDLGVGQPASINNLGEITGATYVGTASIPCVWRHGVRTDLHLPYQDAFLGQINDHGDFTGRYTSEPGGQERAFVVHNGKVTDLGDFGGSYTYATGINDRGQVVGASELPDGTAHPFLWQNGRMIDLSTRGVDPRLTAAAITDRGTVLAGNNLYIPDHR